MVKIILVLLLSTDTITCQRTFCEDNITEGEVVAKIRSSYRDRHKLPDNNGTKVQVELHVQSISSLDEITSDFEIDIFYSQVWRDPKLSFDHITKCYSNLTLGPKFLTDIWKPNICVVIVVL